MPEIQTILQDSACNNKRTDFIKCYWLLPIFLKWESINLLQITVNAQKNRGGVGVILAPKLIVEIGDVRRFHSRSALTAYAGIDTPTYQSGAFTATEKHILKRSNKYLRKTGCQVMLSLIQHKPEQDAI